MVSVINTRATLHGKTSKCTTPRCLVNPKSAEGVYHPELRPNKGTYLGGGGLVVLPPRAVEFSRRQN
jgi:hypothetical protein